MAASSVAGSLYPREIVWPSNVERIEHLARRTPRSTRAQRFTLNVTRADMVRCGWSPSVRLFEAAPAASPIISDCWPGLDDFFRPGRDILVARNADEVLHCLRELPEAERLRIAGNARERVLSLHTALHRAGTLEAYVAEARARHGRARLRRRRIMRAAGSGAPVAEASPP